MQSARSLAVAAGIVFLAVASLHAQVTFEFTHHAADPSFLATGDFDRDGHVDLAVTSNDPNSVWVYSGQGDAKFAAPTQYPVATSPGAVIAVDATSDGWLDLITGSTLLVNDGTGRFTAGQSVPSGIEEVADLNRDVKIDLITLECATAEGSVPPACTISIRLGNGDGTFQLAQQIAETGTRSVVAADLDRNGYDDIVSTVTLSSTEHEVRVRSGSAVGIATEFSSVQIGDFLRGLTAYRGDFNGDAILDLALLGPVPSPDAGSNNVYIAITASSGQLQLLSPVTLGPESGGLVIADLNGDRKQDLVHRSGSPQFGGVAYRLGRGDGSFGSQNSISGFGEPADLVARDLDGDSRQDLVGTEWLGGSVAVARNLSADTNCTTPSAAALAVNICAPAADSSVRTTLTFRASGNSPAGVKRMAIYVDGDKKFETWSDQLRRTLNVPEGTRRISVQAVDRYVGTRTKTIFVNATDSTCAPTGEARTVTICAPGDGDAVSSPVRISAAARPGSSAVTRMNIWVDGEKQYEIMDTAVIDTDLPMSSGTHRITVQAADAQGTFKSTIHVTVGGTGGGTCAEPSADRSVNICQPDNGATVNSPVRVAATANPGSTAILRMNVWVDGEKRYEEKDTSTLAVDLPMAEGTRRITVQAADAGGTFKHTVFVTVGGAGCTPPAAERTVNICTPLDGATVDSPVRVEAAARPGADAIRFMNIWVDGNKQYEVRDTNRIAADLPMLPGAHRVTVQAVEYAGADGRQDTFKATIFITVR